MKNLKRLFALLLALAMMMSMAVTVSATEAQPAPRALPDQSQIVIHGAGAGTTYRVYRILDIVDYTKNANDEYVNIVYCLRSDTDDWDDFFTDAYAGEYFTIENDYVKAVNFVGGEANTGKTAQVLATIAEQYIKDHPDLVCDGEAQPLKSGTHTGSYRQIGMYIMISDRKAAADDYVRHNVFTLFPNGTAVNEKNEPVHSITKEVREDSLHTPSTDTGWVKMNAAEIAQPVDFRIQVDFAPTEGVYMIRDYMPHFDHLDLTKVIVNFNGADVFVENEDYYIRAYRPENTTEGVGFEIELTPSACTYIEDSSSLEIRYTACLKSDAIDANVNTATLFHKAKAVENQPEPQWDDVDEDITTTYTYKLVVSKVDEANQPLAGAEFVLKAGSATAEDNFDFVRINDLTVTVPDGDNTKEITAPAYAVTHPVTSSASTNDPETITTGPGGTFILCGLDSNDDYYLVETKVPEPDEDQDGTVDITYAKADPEHIYITPINNTDTFVRTVKVVNLPTVNMPGTGGTGTTIFYIAGGLLTAAALILLVTKKRMGA